MNTLKARGLLKLSFLCALCLAMTACQSIVRSDVSTFREEGAVLGEGTIFVSAADAVNADDKATTESLEFRFFKDKLTKRLQRAGYVPADKGTAQYHATLSYGVIRQEKDKPDTRVVIGGHFGYYPHYPRGSLLITDVSGTEFEYVREVNVLIDRVASGTNDSAPVLQVKAISLGRCEHLSVVYDEMLEAIFADLNRPNGSVVKVSVKGEANCP